MKQVVQHLKSGTILVEDVPSPALRGPGVLMATACSLISPGTERAALELGRTSLLGKALRRPDQVRKVLANFRREGFWPTIQKVRSRLNTARALGYSAAGVVLESRDSPFAPGDRVAGVGTDAATHAEINFVPRNLCARIPDSVNFEEAAFVALGGIALHAVNLSESKPGEDVAVLGLGPVGLLLANCLAAAGFRVAGFELRRDRLEIARRMGIARSASPDLRSLPETLAKWNLRAGFHRIFIAAASSTREPVEWAVAAARDRAGIIVVGDVHTDFSRNDCYAKELSVVFARSYGAGRYDRDYEGRGINYPPGHFPPAIQDNLVKFLDLLAQKQVTVEPLISHRLPIDQAARAYEIISRTEPSLGVILQYPQSQKSHSRAIQLRAPASADGSIRIGCIGAGAYATGTLFPLLQRDTRAQLATVATTRGLTAKRAAERFGFARCTTDPAEIIADPRIDVVVIATRHDLHSDLLCAALEAGKQHIYLEKPLCLSEDELDRVRQRFNSHVATVGIGFNRRFAPATRACMEFFHSGKAARPAPLEIQYTIHAGLLPDGHWLHDPAQGGRIVGEVCHFVDWCCLLARARVEKLSAVIEGRFPDQDLNAVLTFKNGATAAIHYDTSEHFSLPKETIEVSSAGRSATILDFARLTLRSEQSVRTLRCPGKGQAEMLDEFLNVVSVPRRPLDFQDWSHSTLVTLKLLDSAATRLPVRLEA